MVPKTVASWVCGHGDGDNKANGKASSMNGLCEAHLAYARTLLTMTAANYLYRTATGDAARQHI
jgi:hypothetical protein